MITVKLVYGDCTVVVRTDAELHPDVLDEMARRVVRIFTEIQAGLPDGDSRPEGDDVQA